VREERRGGLADHGRIAPRSDHRVFRSGSIDWAFSSGKRPIIDDAIVYHVRCKEKGAQSNVLIARSTALARSKHKVSPIRN